MPITKDGTTSAILFTEASDRFKTKSTDVHPASEFAICDSQDPIKQVQFDVSGQTTNTATTLAVVGTAARTITFPDATTTLASAASALTNHAVVLGRGVGAMAALALDASTAKVLVSGGAAADPSWAVVGVAGGGTGLAAGTSGGIPAYTGTTTVTSSGLLAANGIVLGGGAGAVPATLATDSSVAKCLVSGGTNTAPSWAVLSIAGGGTGQVTKAAGYDALGPMTTAGDIEYGGVAGTGTRLALGAQQGMALVAGASAPAWAAPGLFYASSLINANLTLNANDTVDFSTTFSFSFTPAVTGAYIISVVAAYDVSVAIDCYVDIVRISGTEVALIQGGGLYLGSPGGVAIPEGVLNCRRIARLTGGAAYTYNFRGKSNGAGTVQVRGALGTGGGIVMLAQCIGA